MAHWIIDYRGFGGTYYKCSECGENWCDIYSDVSIEENCPNCGALINEDEVEYIEKKKKNDMKKLIELFAAGYTLQPPTYLSFEDLEKEV